MTAEDLRTVGLILGAMMLSGLLLGTLLLALAVRQVRRIDIPPDAGLADTLHLTPFLIVLAIDLLDFGLDFLAAPVSWVILDRLGLKALRGISVVEALIPVTQFIPTLTLAWLAVRLFGIRSGGPGTKIIDQYR